MRRLLVILVWVVCANGSAEVVSGGTQRTLSVLPTTDGSGLKLESALQNELATLFRQTDAFNVSLGNQTVPAFSTDEISKVHQALGTEVISFVYVEKERVAVFLFDSARPDKFLVSSQPLTNSPENRLTAPWIDARFRDAFQQLYKSYSAGVFQALPGTEVDAQTQKNDDESRDKKARRLFRELSSISDTLYYWGIGLGMTRLNNSGNSASTVMISGLSGVRMSEKLRLELGVRLFSYLMLDLGLKYQIPLAERYLSLYVTFGSGMVLSGITENRTVGAVVMRTGSMLAGPGISFDVPLVGANIRGEITYYTGAGSVLAATYGVTYSF